VAEVDLILHSGRVRTLDPARPCAQAIAISDGHVVAVGRNSEILPLAGKSTTATDVQDAAVIPGLTDSHVHPFWGAAITRGADLSCARSRDDVAEALSTESALCGSGEWVLGYGLDYNVFDQTRGVDRTVVEDAVGSRPALVTFADLHTGIATQAALDLAGIDGPVGFDERAEVVCVNGVPTGELREIPALELVRSAIPPLSPSGWYSLCVRQLQCFASVGLTGAHVMDGDLTTLDLLRELEVNGDLITRMIVPFWIKPNMPEEQWEVFAVHRDDGGARWRGKVAKFFLDGVIDTGTGWLFEPDAHGEGLEPYWSDVERYHRAIAFFSERGFQCVTHAIGDRAVHEALNAYRNAGPPNGSGSTRHRIEHIETLQAEDLSRFAQEGVVASMQPQHLMWLSADRTDNWSRRLGPDRCARAYPTLALLQTGVVVAFGSDWPVAHYDPRQGLAAAQLRRPAGETTRSPYDSNGVDGIAALRGYTTLPAAAVGEEGLNGLLRVGFRADITVMAEDPVDCPADDLPTDAVLLTVVAGDVVYADSALL
jgi:predicted amidohydrolase YtcJ